MRDKENSSYLLGMSSLPGPISRKGRWGGISVLLEGGIGQAQRSLALSPSLRLSGRKVRKETRFSLGAGIRELTPVFLGTPPNRANEHLDSFFAGLA